MHAPTFKTRHFTARLWTVLIVLVTVIAILPACKKPVAKKATPKPITPVPATPTPVVVKATPEPTPMPVVVATPTPAPPTPPPLDLATVVRTPGLWPAQVLLTQPHGFPVMISGRVAGEVKVPAGTPLKLIRVFGPQVEVEYQNAIHIVPTDSTDLMPRAVAISKNPALARPTPMPAPVFVPGTVITPVPIVDLTAEQIAQRVTVDVTRIKRSRSEEEEKKDGAAATPTPAPGQRRANNPRRNYRQNDEEESIELRVRLTNTDSNRAARRLKGEIFIFADSLADRSALKLLGSHPIDCSIQPRGNHEFTTTELTTRFWTTQRYGFKYDSWIVRIRNAEDKEVLLKSNSPSLLRNAAKLATMAAGKTYERSTFEPVDVPR